LQSKQDARSLLLGLSISQCLLSLSFVSLVDSVSSESPVSLEVFHCSGQFLWLASWLEGWDSQDTVFSVLNWVLQLFSSGIVDFSLLGNSSMSWEQHELGFVGGESLYISGLIISILVMSSVINSDTNTTGKSWGEASSSDFSKGETSSKLELGAIFKSLSMNQRSQFANWTRRESCGLGSSSFLSESLVSLFVEETVDSSHPMLSQVRTLKYIIVFYHVAY